MMPPSYPIKTLILVLAASFLIICVGIAQASYQQVYNTSTMRENNLTEYNTTSLSYVDIVNLNILTNVSGESTFSIQSKISPGTGGNVQLVVNGVVLRIFTITSGQTDYGWFNYSLVRAFNTTDTIKYQALKDTSGTIYVQNARHTYDNVAAPTITSPANNSAQTSRTVNATWIGTSPFQYNISQNANCSSPYITGTTSNNFTGNQTFNVGLNYLCVRGYNTTENSITNWSTNTIIIYDVVTNLGGSGYNWSSNGTLSNQTWDRYTNERVFGLYQNTGCNNWTEYYGNSANLSCSGDWLKYTNTGTMPVTYILPGESITGSDIEITFLQNSTGGWGPMTGTAYRYQNFTYTYQFLDYQHTGNYIQSKINGAYRTINLSTSFLPIGNKTYNSKIQVYSNNHKGKYWNATELGWLGEGTDSNFTSGNFGMYVRDTAYFKDFWVKNLTSGGTLISSGNYTTGQSDAGAGKRYTGVYAYIKNESAGSVNVYINYSDDQVSWSTVSYIGLKNSSLLYIPSARYVIITDTITGTSSDSPRLVQYNLYSNNIDAVYGYVKYLNGTGVNGAKIGYYNNWSTTDSSGYYFIDDLPAGNITIATGLNGLNSSADILKFNGTAQYYQNFTIDMFSQPPLNQFILTVANATREMLYCHDLYGNYTVNCYPEEDASYFKDESTNNPSQSDYILYPIAQVYASGANRTPEFYERVISIMDAYAQDIAFDTGRGDNTGWTMNQLMQAYSSLNKTGSMTISFDTRERQLISNFNYTRYDNYINGQWNSTITGNGNYIYFETYGEQIRIYYGLTSDTTYRNTSINTIILHRLPHPEYTAYSETTINTYYNAQMGAALKDMRDNYGYVPINSSYNSTISDITNWTKGMLLQDGELVAVGRSQGNPADAAGYAMVGAIFGDSESYRILDISTTKVLSTIGWRNTTFYPSRDYYTPYRKTGGYYAWYKINSAALWFLTRASELYDPSIVESDFVRNSFDDFNDTGVIILNSGNYSIYMHRLFSDRANRISFINGTGVIPLRFIATIKDAMNQTIAFMPAISEGNNVTTKVYQPSAVWAGYNDSYDYLNNSFYFIQFDNFTQGLNVTSFNNTEYPQDDVSEHIANISYGIDSSNSRIYMNWTKLKMLDGSDFGYFNISVYQHDDLINVTYSFKGGSFSNFSLPLFFLVDDNRTAATRTVNGLTYNHSRGKETVNITNVTGTGLTPTSIDASDENPGLSPYGYTKITYIYGDITSSGDISLSYDMKISTTNEYGFALNQPPAVWSNSTSPITTGLGAIETFNVEFTQNLDTIQWLVNGTTVEWDNSTSIGSYTNTSNVAGLWNLSAIGCNAQGCAIQTWYWTVDGTPPASITNLTNVTTSTSANWSWDNPADSDLNYTMIYINNTWITNTSAMFYLNSSFIPGTQYTISTRTVDIYGNINASWVNRTTTTLPLGSITNLIAEEGTMYINWTWDNPIGLNVVMIYIGGDFVENTSSNYYNYTGIEFIQTISTHTVDINGIINQTWVNHTASMYESPINETNTSNIRPGPYGMQFFSYNAGNDPAKRFDTVNKTWGQRFRFTSSATRNGTNLAINWYCADGLETLPSVSTGLPCPNSTGQTYIMGIMSDNSTNPAKPRPSGTWLGWTNVTQPKHNYLEDFALSLNVTLQADQLYWLVAKWGNGTEPDEYHWLEWMGMASHNYTFLGYDYKNQSNDRSGYNNGLIEAFSSSGDFAGDDWSYDYSLKTWYITLNDSTTFGNPVSHGYSGVGSYSKPGDYLRIRERFTPEDNYTLTLVNAQCGDLWDGNNPDGDLEYKIYNTSNEGVLLASGVLNTSQELHDYYNLSPSTNRFRWCTKPLSSNVNIYKGVEFAFEVSCPNCSSLRYYMFDSPEVRSPYTSKAKNITFGGQTNWMQYYRNISGTMQWGNESFMRDYPVHFDYLSSPGSSYVPPTPIWVSNNTGYYWANHTWQAGVGNGTDSYNISVNGTWYNSTATSFNSSLAPAGCSNITVWAYNNTGVTSTTNITNNSCAPASPSYAPSITSYSPVDFTPSYSIGALATFEAGSNQSVSWTWTGATEGAGDGTTNSTATQTWLTAGAKTVTVTCSNANGSCGTVQWAVTVDPDPAAGYNISGYVTYVNTSPVEGARIRVWGAENTSDVNGYYALYGLSSGNYTILFEKDYYYDGVARIFLSDNATQNYTFVSKVHVSTPGFTGILALLGILLTAALYRHRNR